MDMNTNPLQQALACEPNPIQMDGARSNRLYCAICDALAANEALTTTVDRFTGAVAAPPGEIDARLAVEAYGRIIKDRLTLVLMMIEGEDVDAAARAPGKVPA